MENINIHLADEEAIYVITRTGQRELLNLNKITDRLQKLARRHPKINHINAYELMLKVGTGLKSEITTYEIDEYTANAAASMSITNPYYMKLASRIIIDNHQKITLGNFLDKMKLAYFRKDHSGIISPLLSKEFFNYVEDNHNTIQKFIDYDRDFLLDLFGFKTFLSIYSLKIDKKPIERPQDMFMRTAIALHMHTKIISKHENNIEYNTDEELVMIKNTYDSLSKLQYSQASPTYFNAGTKKTQYSSCFLLGSDDDTNKIMDTAKEMANISKWGGGIGIHAHNIRGSGSLIRGTNGYSNGIVPFLQIYNSTIRAFNQGGKREGAAAVYLMLHHPDIETFLKLRLPNGSEENRARSLFYAVWIPDLFMERVRDGKMWSLFDPNKTYDLSNLYDEICKEDDKSGKRYTNKYLDMEEKKMYSRQLPAREIWELIYNANKVTGMPYICFSDTINKYSMQKNIGTIKSSNLCVSGDTVILTDLGYRNIMYLSESKPPVATIWNGEEWTEATFAKTGTKKELLNITFSDLTELKCTAGHKFAIWEPSAKDGYLERNASSLKIGDILYTNKFPVINDNLDTRIKYLSDQINIISSDKSKVNLVKLYCNTIGTNPFIQYDDMHKNYRLNFSVKDQIQLNKFKLHSHHIISDEKNTLKVLKIEKVSTLMDTYCFNEPKKHMGIFNGVLAMNCAEIVEYSDSNQTAVCNLCSVNLAACVKDIYTPEEKNMDESNRRELDHEFPVNPYFDFKQLTSMTTLATINLNNIIDKNFYPDYKTYRNNMRYRPIAIGIQGLANTFAKLRYSFESDEAKVLNKNISECMYYAALSQSSKISKEIYKELVVTCKEKGEVSYLCYTNIKNWPDRFSPEEETFIFKVTNHALIPKNIGAYPGMNWNGGSPLHQPTDIGNTRNTTNTTNTGNPDCNNSDVKFHWELYGLKESDLSGMFDWGTLREHIKIYGVRNSLLLANMPTASTSQLLGNNESFEPFTSNIYKRKTLAGEFIVINKYLIRDLYNLGLWNSKIKDYLIALEGSIQAIEGIPDEIKKLYKTSWEIDQKKLITLAADRQPFIDQAQSLNWFLEDVSLAEFNKLAFHAWNLKLKTGKYYLHSRPAIHAEKFSIDPKLQQEMKEKLEKDKSKRNTSFMEPLKDVCELCSG